MNRDQYIIALTGGIGSGKSTVANAFAALGVPLVDADVIARRELIQPESLALRTIVQHFGMAILSSDGLLDRTALRALIFNDLTEKTWLNSLLHPIIQWQTEHQLRLVHAPYVLWVVPLLIENNLQWRANRVLVVDVDCERQIERTINRDGVSQQQVENILAAQVPRQQRLAYANDIIDNSGRLEEIRNSVAVLHQHYLTLAVSAVQQTNRHK